MHKVSKSTPCPADELEKLLHERTNVERTFQIDTYTFDIVKAYREDFLE